MTQKELNKKIEQIQEREFEDIVERSLILKVINQHVKEVIGEDLETTNYMYFYKDKYKNVPKDFKETIIKACIQYDNDLKEEQRKRAGL